MIYELAYIYIIYDIEDHNLVYYGSTCDLKTRMYTHKCLKINTCVSKKIIERGNYEYAILESYENIDEYDLVERERWYILNKPCINKKVPHRTDAEYRQNNKEKIAEQKKEKFVCECGGKFTKTHTARHKKSKKHLKWIQSCKI